MGRREQVSEARLQVALEAAARWRERTPDRAKSQERYLAEGPARADTPDRTAKFQARERLRARANPTAAIENFPVVLERQIGPTLDFTSYPPDEEARRAGMPVARILEMPERGVIPEGFGTGFLVSPQLLITNHHVFGSLAEASGCGANFLHEYRAGGLHLGPIFELDPDAFFLSDSNLDFALVAVKPQAPDARLDSFKFIRLIGTEGKILVGHPISIIQHPRGGPKQYVTTQNKLLDILEEQGFVHYSSDTLRGSSGSPAFNKYWEIVALHHSGVPLMQSGKIMAKDGRPWDQSTMSDDEVMWVANEGIRISRIVQHLSQLRLVDANKAALLANLLRTTADPLLTEGAQMTTPPTLTPPPAGAGHVTINVAGNATMFINSGGLTSTVPSPIPEGPPTTALPSAPGAAVLERQIRFDMNYRKRRGYDPRFLPGTEIPLPTALVRDAELLKGEDRKPLLLKYHHFSLVMNRHRRLVMWTAVNVDYSPERKSTRNRQEFGTDRWVPDPRIPAECQIWDEDFYKPATKIDRGHIVVRELGHVPLDELHSAARSLQPGQAQGPMGGAGSPHHRPNRCRRQSRIDLRRACVGQRE
jgi:endonuclease G